MDRAGSNWTEAAHALRATLAARVPGQSAPNASGLVVEVVERTGSTNSDLLDRLRQGERSLQVLAAQRQDAGRGRLGRTWEAPPGAALTFSVALPMAPRAGWSGLSVAVGLALAQALQPARWADTHRLMLKWPNDLWWCAVHPSGRSSHPAEGRKVVGVLVETVPLPFEAAGDPPGLRGVVVGVGVNIAPMQLEGVHPAWTQLWRPEDTPPAAWQQCAVALVDALVHFERHGLQGSAEALSVRDLLKGEPVALSTDPAIAWVAEGIADDGALCVRRADDPSQRRRVVSGEVSVRPWAASGPMDAA